MSSLRINSQTRAVSERTTLPGGDSRAGEASADGVGFAAALGAAAAPAPGSAPTAYGGKSDGEGDGASRHKPADGVVDGAAAMLMMPTAPPSPGGGTSESGDTAGIAAAGLGSAPDIAPPTSPAAPANLFDVAHAAAPSNIGAPVAAGTTAAQIDGSLIPAAAGDLPSVAAVTPVPLALGGQDPGVTAQGTDPGAAASSHDLPAVIDTPLAAAGFAPAQHPADRLSVALPPPNPPGCGAAVAPQVSNPAAMAADLAGPAPSPGRLDAAAADASLPLADPGGADDGIGATASDRGRSSQSVGRFDLRDTQTDSPIGVGVGVGVPSAGAPTTPAGTAPGVETPGGIADQVSAALVRLAAGSSREMVMRLHPPELGDVTVRIAVAGREVSAWFGSPQPQVQLAIGGGLAQLQTDLGNAGYNLSGAWVGADASNPRQQSMAPPVPPARQAPSAPGFATAVATPSRAAASGVNVYV